MVCDKYRVRVFCVVSCKVTGKQILAGRAAHVRAQSAIYGYYRWVRVAWCHVPSGV